MKNNMNSFAVRASVVAVQSALLTIGSYSLAYADQALDDMITPTNSVEIGVANTDKGSYKFGEYNGLQKKGASLVGGFDVSGGGGDKSAVRYRFTGSDLGLDTRNLSFEYGEQGKFRIKLGYDEIVKNSSDTFQTPYSGAGTGTLTLPATWATKAANCTVTGVGGVVGAVVGTAGCGNYHVVQVTTGGNSTATPTGNMAAMTAAEQAAFQNVNLSTQRKKGDLGLNFIIDKQWQISASATHETKDGLQAMGMAAPGTTTNAQVTILNPIKYTTDQLNLNLAYNGEKAYGQVAYYASFFKNDINSVVFENPYASALTPSISAAGAVTFPWGTWGRMSTAPSNQFHQLNLSGGYKFDKTTKLVANLAYSRNTQNDAFLPERMEGATAAVAQPTTSLNGVVVTKSVNLKLTSRPIKELGLLAAYKYDDRDNRTPTNLYTWRDTDGQTAGTNRAAYNWAYSKKLSQLNLEADWAFQKGQAVKLGLEQQKINRHCDSGVWASGCVNSADHTERTTSIDYRNTMLETITAKLGYSASSRRVSDYTLGSASLTANNNPNSQGPLTRFSMSDRERDKLRAAVTWQATPELELSAGYDYSKDRYATGKGQYLLSTLKDVGLKTADSNVFNLDGSYRVSDAFTLNAFYSREDRSSKLQGNAGRGATFTAASDWGVDMKEKVDTYGFGFKAVVGGKWDLAGDYIRTEAKLPFDLFAASQSAFNTTTSAQTANAYANYGFPDTFEKSDTLKLNAKYMVDKTSSWRFGYSYQKLSSADPLRYTGLQTGTATSVQAGGATVAVNGVAVPAANVYTAQQLVPTNEQAPNYTVHSVAVTYIYSFK